MANKAKELFDLTVNELSLVDYAANEEEFLIFKQLNQEDIKMSNTVEPTVVPAEAEEVAEVKEVTEEAAVAEVVAEKAEEEEVAEVVEPTSDDKLVETVAKATAEAVSKSMEDFVATLKSLLTQEAVVEEVAVVSEEEVVVEPETAPVVEEEDVSKTLFAKIDALVTALTPTKVEKAEVVEDKEETAVEKSLAKIEKQLTGMDSRLAEIEGTQMPSQALDAATDTTVEKAKEESVFKGLL